MNKSRIYPIRKPLCGSVMADFNFVDLVLPCLRILLLFLSLLPPNCSKRT